MDKIEAALMEVDELEEYFFQKIEWTESELMDWYVKCITLFEVIEMREKSIDDFSVFFNTFILQEDNENNSIFVVTDYPRIFKTKTASIHLAKIKATFTLARKKIDFLKEADRIVPNFIIKHFESSQSYDHIFTSVISINSSVENKNIESIITSANTLLDSILDEIESLKDKNLSKKLSVLLTDNQLREKLGFDKQVIYSLDNSRVTRNVELVHPKSNIKQSIPYICAVSYAYLVIFQLKLMLSLGYFS